MSAHSLGLPVRELRAEAARVDTGSQPPVEHLHPGFPRGMRNRVGVLQLRRQRAARQPLREVGRLPFRKWSTMFSAPRTEGDPIPVEEPSAGDRAAAQPPLLRRPHVQSLTVERHAIEVAGSRCPPSRAASAAALAIFWPIHDERNGGVKIKILGARGSRPSPGPRDAALRRQHLVRSVDVVGRDDHRFSRRHGIPQSRPRAGRTGSRTSTSCSPTWHLDHIQGSISSLGVRPQSEMSIWGPEGAGGLAARPIARYISARWRRSRLRTALRRPVHGRAPRRIGHSARRGSAPLGHPPRPDAGLPITEGDTSLCYISPPEPALARTLDDLDRDCISGYDLAARRSLFIQTASTPTTSTPTTSAGATRALTDTLIVAHRTRRAPPLFTDPLHTDDFLYV